MPCSLSENFPWTPLLTARELLAAGHLQLAFVQRGESWQCEPSERCDLTSAAAVLLVGSGDHTKEAARTAPCAVTYYRVGDGGLPRLERRAPQEHHGIEQGFATAICVYLPVLLGSAAARREGRSFVAGHVTQTLDGRIACENGQSQWIGNQADLVHAHRMRALLDGVLVGATTALRDDPQLNVRHVEGPDPRRVVLSGRGGVVRAEQSLKVLQDPGCELLVGRAHAMAPPHPSVHVHAIDDVDGKIPPSSALATLRACGVHSIYLEGGAGTLSSFLQAGLVDVLQVHIASMLLGSGLPSLQLPTVEHVRDGLHVKMNHAMLDGHVLLTCMPTARQS